jgi:hypothetical protein
MEHGAYLLFGSWVDVKVVLTSDGDHSRGTMGNGTGEYKVLWYDMLSMLVRDSIVRYIHHGETREWSRRGLRLCQDEE